MTFFRFHSLAIQWRVEELLKNVKIAEKKYKNIVGVLYNVDEIRVFITLL